MYVVLNKKVSCHSKNTLMSNKKLLCRNVLLERRAIVSCSVILTGGCFFHLVNIFSPILFLTFTKGPSRNWRKFSSSQCGSEFGRGKEKLKYGSLVISSHMNIEIKNVLSSYVKITIRQQEICSI